MIATKMVVSQFLNTFIFFLFIFIFTKLDITFFRMIFYYIIPKHPLMLYYEEKVLHKS